MAIIALGESNVSGEIAVSGMRERKETHLFLVTVTDQNYEVNVAGY